jgi:Flp pilus assembly pilin Flp
MPSRNNFLKKGGEEGMLRKMRGQSTVEYALILTVALLAVVYGVSIIRGKMTTNVDNAGTMLDKAATEFKTATQ